MLTSGRDHHSESSVLRPSGGRNPEKREMFYPIMEGLEGAFRLTHATSMEAGIQKCWNKGLTHQRTLKYGSRAWHLRCTQI